VSATTAHDYDAYYYPTHGAPALALPYLRISLADDDRTTLYLDPARAQLLARHTQRTRLERWLYHGLHSLDFPLLYEHRVLWRTSVMLAMAVGLTLSSLGLAMALRRHRRRRRSRQRQIGKTG
jgi:hypothetical protein